MQRRPRLSFRYVTTLQKNHAEPVRNNNFVETSIFVTNYSGTSGLTFSEMVTITVYRSFVIQLFPGMFSHCSDIPKVKDESRV